MGIMNKISKAAPKLASRATRSQRKKGALASKAEAAAQAAAAGGLSKRPRGKTLGAAMSKSYPQGLAATLRRKPTAGTRGRPSRRDAIPAGIPRKRSR